MQRSMFSVVIILFLPLQADNQQRLEQLQRAVKVPPAVVEQLQQLVPSQKFQHTAWRMPTKALAWPLYRAYPRLKRTLPHVQLCGAATPVHRLAVSKQLGISCWVKRDDKTCPDGFGGNKPRLLETVLAPVVRDTMHEHGRPYDTVVTFGCVGSNHAVATAAWAQKLGLHCILMLKPQPSSKTVRRNLLLMQHYGAQIHYYPNEEKRTQAMLELFQRYYQEHGVFPYVLPTGAALPLSCVGYVNAAFELKEQIEQGLLPQPDVIYLPVGGTFSAGVSCCTTAGLVVGLAAAGLPTKVVAVATQPENPAAYKKAIIAMMHEVNTLLHTADKNFPLLDHPEQQLDIVYDCAGKSYGLFTQAGKDAIQLLQQADGIMLDGTYSGKAFAALIRDARAGKLQEKKVLFWNTFCGSDFTPQVDYDDYKKLPAGLHVYFEKPTQPLDS